MGYRCAVKLVVWLAILISVVPVTRAQSIVTGAVSGPITDPSAAVLPNATVTLTNTATGDVQRTTTNSSGVFTLARYTSGAQNSGALNIVRSTVLMSPPLVLND